MVTNSPSTATQRTIRFSRTVSLWRAVALGSSLTVGLGVFILIGLFLQQAGPQTPRAYLLALLLFLPIILTYAERAAVTPGTGGLFALARAGSLNWRTYATGWLLLGGHLALIALLGWGAALYLNISLERLLNVSVALRWLAPGMVILVALNDLLGTQGTWRLRTPIVYGSLLALLSLAAWAWFQPTSANAPLPEATTASGDLQVLALMAASLWGIHVLLDSRDEMRRPERVMLPALLVPLLLSGGLGALAAAARLRMVMSGLSPGDVTPLETLAVNMSIFGNPLMEVTIVTMGLMISVIALDRTMVTMLRLVGTMVRDGFLPEQMLTISPGFGTPLIALRLLALVSALAAAFAPSLLLVSLVALAFLWTSLLLNLPYVLQLIPARLPEQRRLKLPFFPLFPALTSVICLVLSAVLPVTAILVALGWGLVGLFYYVGYARKGELATRRRESVVGDMGVVPPKKVYTVLVGIANPETAPALIRSGAMLARSRGGRVLVLEVFIFPDQVPQHIQRQLAQSQIQDLQHLVEQTDVGEVPVEVLVRLAQSPVDGILGTSQEERVDLILLGWEGEHTGGPFDLGPLLDPVVRTATCDVVVLHGCLPERIERVLVPTADSQNSMAAIKLAQRMIDGQPGQIVALNLVQEAYLPDSVEQARQRLQAMISRHDGISPVELQVFPAEDVRESILEAAPDFDLVILGASRGGVLDQAIFGGLPVEVARSSPRPVLLVKHYEGARRFWERRAWEILSAPFPKLTIFERTEISQQMRQSANPSIDFFILIGLSATIATMGLHQGSPAVIIGAMLVAPLMSPILAMAMSIVHGDLRLLRLTVRSTFSGIALAIGLSMLVTAVTPTPIDTTEILARTQPTLLDLIVALASGAAGGYAAARKEVAAALPGVAIAAALVPPLGVIGYGTAIGDLEIAGGSLLLFTTNLIAIVVAASVVYLLLGFRPARARLRGQVRLKFMVSILALVLISIPLAVLSVNTLDRITRQTQIESFLSREVATAPVQITDVIVQEQEDGQEDGLVVYATIYALEEFSTEQIADIQARLNSEFAQPIMLRATVLRAVMLPELEDRAPPTPEPGR
jgi:uncharacterized hydrophobic protein (TIGR00271 family)